MNNIKTLILIIISVLFSGSAFAKTDLTLRLDSAVKKSDEKQPYYLVSGELNKIVDGHTTDTCNFFNQRVNISTIKGEETKDPTTFDRIKCGNADVWAQAVNFYYSSIHGTYIKFKLIDDGQALTAQSTLDARPNSIGPK